MCLRRKIYIYAYLLYTLPILWIKKTYIYIAPHCRFNEQTYFTLVCFNIISFHFVRTIIHHNMCCDKKTSRALTHWWAELRWTILIHYYFEFLIKILPNSIILYLKLKLCVLLFIEQLNLFSMGFWIHWFPDAFGCGPTLGGIFSCNTLLIHLRSL